MDSWKLLEQLGEDYSHCVCWAISPRWKVGYVRACLVQGIGGIKCNELVELVIGRTQVFMVDETPQLWISNGSGLVVFKLT